MPQIFQVLSCYKCLVFQVHQTKKSNKFQCKICGDKQSIKRHYGVGTAKDCRMHVQRLNGIRGEINDLKEIKSDSEEENELNINKVQSKVPATQSEKSKWSDYVDKNEEESSKSVPKSESMYLNNTEVVLEVPKKRSRINFKCPSLTMSSKTNNENSYCEGRVTNTVVSSQATQDCVSFSERKFDKLESSVVFNDDCANVKRISEVKEYVKPLVNFVKEARKNMAPTNNTNSKWAQYVEEEQEEDDTEEFDNFLANNETIVTASHLQEYKNNFDEDRATASRNAQELFALCNDNDIDDVLDI